MGLGMRGLVWGSQITGLQDAHRLLVYDHPGVGESEACEAWPTMGVLAGHALRLLDEVQWQGVHLVGVSMGGMIAQEIALAAPGRFRSLTLIATHPGGPTGWVPPLRGLSLFVQANVQGPRERVQTLRQLLYTPEFLARADGPELEQRMRDSVSVRAKRSTIFGQLHAVGRHDTRSRLGALSLPALIVRPGRDILVRPSHSDHLHRLIPGSRLLRLDDAGHGVIFQEAPALNAALQEHFASAELSSV